MTDATKAGLPRLAFADAAGRWAWLRRHATAPGVWLKLAKILWDQLRLDESWGEAPPPSREGANGLNILQTLVSYRRVWRLTP